MSRIKRKLRRLKHSKLAQLFAKLAPADQPNVSDAESMRWLFGKLGVDAAGVGEVTSGESLTDVMGAFDALLDDPEQIKSAYAKAASAMGGCGS